MTPSGGSDSKPRAWSVVGEQPDELRIRSYRDGDDLDRVFVVVDSAAAHEERRDLIQAASRAAYQGGMRDAGVREDLLAAIDRALR